MQRLGPPLKGDLIEVHWLDIYEDVQGDPTKATLYKRISVGFFWEEKEDNGIPVIVTTTTIDKDSADSGYVIYPRCCVTQIKVIRRKRRSKKDGLRNSDRAT